MNNILRNNGLKYIARHFSVSSRNDKTFSCKLLVVGGGTGGCTVAAKFVKHLPKDSVIVLEPSWEHYYQPLFTLVGGGVTTVGACRRLEKAVLPSGVEWVQDTAECLDPEKCFVKTSSGHVINYEYVVIATGLQNDYSKVPGLIEGLQDPNSGVSTIFAPEYAEKTWSDLQKFKSGDAVFTYPDSQIKCPGAPQKIAYLADSYFTKTDKRDRARITFNTCLPVIFGVKKYADELLKVAARKKIKVNYTTVLKEIYPDRKEALFINKVNQQPLLMQYSMLHVTPPMHTAAFIRQNEKLSDPCGFLDVDKYTLQQKKYPNIYGLGDCTNTPNSKTAAAISKQCYVLEKNLISTMFSKKPEQKYDGYGACPLITSYNTCIIAEFVYDGIPKETFPFNQAKERVLAYYMKKDLFPFIYWNFMLKGKYHGPDFVRRIVNPFAK